MTPGCRLRITMQIYTPTKIATDGLYKIRKLALVTPTFGHKVGHLATKFLPTEVRILKFGAAHMCPEDGEKHRYEGFVHVF